MASDDVYLAIFQEIYNDRQALGKLMQLTRRALGNRFYNTTDK
jgi:hypothetical protein